MNIVTYKENWANGVLLRAVALPGENERVCAGPGLLTRRFGINKSHDNLPISVENGLWLIDKSSAINMQKVVQTTRIGISKAKNLNWRWYLHSSRSVSKRVQGDSLPPISSAWHPSSNEAP